MTDSQTEPGWRHATGDPQGTRRYWDGASWTGELQTWDPTTGAPSAVGTSAESDGTAGIASALDRINAAIVDAALVTTFLFFSGFTYILFIASDESLSDQFFEAEGLGIGFVSSLLLFIWACLWDSLKGGTPGELIFGIRIIKKGQTGPPGAIAALKRNASYLIGLIPVVGPIVGVIWLVSVYLLFYTDLRQTVMDKFAGTVVVDKQHARRSSSSPLEIAA